MMSSTVVADVVDWMMSSTVAADVVDWMMSSSVVADAVYRITVCAITKVTRNSHEDGGWHCVYEILCFELT